MKNPPLKKNPDFGRPTSPLNQALGMAIRPKVFEVIPSGVSRLVPAPILRLRQSGPKTGAQRIASELLKIMADFLIRKEGVC